MNYPPMQVDTVCRDGHEAEIHVIHDIAQSYSRSVDPRAMKEARRSLPYGRWELFDVDYGVETIDRRCRSVFHYRRPTSNGKG